MVSTPNWRRGFLFSLTFACLIFRLNAQLPEVFSKLKLDTSCDSFLWIGSTGKGLPPEAQENQLVQSSRTAELLFQMLRSHTVACDKIPSFRTLMANRRVLQQKEAAIPLVIMETNYQRFKPNALEEGLVVLENGFLQFPKEQSSDALQNHQTLILDLGISEIDQAERWYWDPAFFLTNENGFPDELRINFGDGWRTLSAQPELLKVDFTNLSQEPIIQLELRRGEKWKKVRVVLKSNICISAFPLPHAAPWAQESADFPWQFSVDGMKANAYTLWSEDGVFDKPFIFVEGIDFEYNHSAEKNGKFGWCQFTGGYTNGQMDFPMLAQLPVLLHDLRDRGFDIIMLDFYDGAARIEDNGKLLEELIERCNHHKESLEPIILAGASMGGQVARYTLRSMEMEGKSHCTSIFISLDSPHQGAYIPAALQETIYELSSYVSEAAMMIDDKLMRPAARQMLIYQINQPLAYEPTAPMFLNWQQWKEQNGLPRKSRNIAIANGSGIATNLISNTSEMLLDYGCEYAGEFPLIKLDLYPLPGNSTHEASNPIASVIADITFTENLGLFNGTLTGINQYILRPIVHPLWKKWDYAPGGTRSSISELVNALNQNQDFTSQCEQISEDEFNEDHCFVSTASALDLPNINPNTAVSALLSGNPNLCAFDSWFIQSTNQQHVEVQQECIDWIEAAVFAGVQENGDSWLPNIFSGEESAFNFYRNSFSRIPSVVVSGGAHLMVNNHLAGHYSDPAPSLFSTLRTTLGGLCASSTISLTSGGRLTIGDSNGSTRGELIVESGGLIRILENAVCKVNLGSKLIVKDGGTIRIDFNGLLELNGGELILEKGGAVYLADGRIVMNHTNAKIHFRGGIIELEESVSWTPFDPNASSHGKFIVYPEGDDDIILSENAVLFLEGFSAQDNGVFFEPLGHFNCRGVDGSSLRVHNLKIDMNQATDWAINTNASFYNCHFVSHLPEAKLSTWGYQAHFEKSRFERVFTFLNNTKTAAWKCKWVGMDAGVSALSANYSFHYCEFNGCGMASSQMDEACYLDQCSFDGEYGPMIGFIDKATEKIFITDCDWKRYGIATEKLNGRLVAKCCSWDDNTTALVLRDGAKWIASTDLGGGYNQFHSNAVHAFFEEASSPELNNGHNLFEWAAQALFEGNISDMSCSWSCSSTPMYAHYNNWNDQLNAHYNLHTGDVCYNNHPCPIKIIDFYETDETNCEVSELFAFEKRSNENGVAAWESKERKAATLFPNPSSEQVKIEGISPNDIINISIYNAQGQQCKLIYTDEQNTNIFSVEHLSPGVYTVRIECTDHLVPLCLVVE